MTKAYLILFFCACVAALGRLAAAQTTVGSQPESCDRACLNDPLDDYIVALKMHDPSHPPLAQSGRFTENNLPLEPRDDLWNTIDAVSDYRFPFFEPESGQGGLFGVVEENG